MTEQSVAIALRGVSKRYGSATALEPVDLDIHEGEFFCLLGPSGCGKTTTLNVIGGFVAPSSGEIHIRGERVDRVPPHKRAVNTVFQSYALFPHMTVADNVGFGLKMARVPKTEARGRVTEALSMVALDDFADRLPGHLSGGQQQRVAVARALVNNPAVLLLDEPLGALDLKLRKRLQIELAQIHHDVNTTFVLVTHDQEEAMAMGDRIAVMNEGRVEQVGSPAEIYRHPVNRFVADFIGESNFIEVNLDNDRVRGPGGVELPGRSRCRERRRNSDGAARTRNSHCRSRVGASGNHRQDRVPRQLPAGGNQRRRCRGSSGGVAVWRGGGRADSTPRRPRDTHVGQRGRRGISPRRPHNRRRRGMTQKRVTRRGALQVGALGALSMYAAACGSSSSSGSSGSSGAANGGDINWLTWSDHWSPQQIKAVKAQTKIAATPTLFSDDSEGYLKIKQTGGQFGMASIDALWAPKFHGDGLTQGFDIDEIKVSKELYPLARNFPFFQSGGQSIGYPFAWSTIQIYYNPTNVTTKPDSWHALLDPKPTRARSWPRTSRPTWSRWPDAPPAPRIRTTRRPTS